MLKDWLQFTFKHRIDWDIHKLSATHLVALDKEAEKNVEEKEYYEGNFADKVLDLVKNKDDTSAEVTKDDDPLKEEKTTEAAQLTLAKVLLYHIPDFEDSEILGESFSYTLETVVHLIYYNLFSTRVKVKISWIQRNK